MYLIIADMFSQILDDKDKTYDIRVSYVEIYNEVIRDLLVPNSKDTYLDLRDDPIESNVKSKTEKRKLVVALKGLIDKGIFTF